MIANESPPERLETLSPPIYSAYRHIAGLLRPGDLALDVGCGNGKVAAYLQETSGAIFDGVDPSLPRAEEARGHLRYVSTQLASEGDDDPDLAPGYRLVMFLDVVEHLVDPSSVLDWAGKRLAPGGTLVVLIPNSAHWTFRREMLRGRWRYQEFGLFDRTHLRFFDPDTARELRPVGMIEAGRYYFTPGGLQSQLGVRLWPRLFALHILLEWKLEL